MLSQMQANQIRIDAYRNLASLPADQAAAVRRDVEINIAGANHSTPTIDTKAVDLNSMGSRELILLGMQQSRARRQSGLRR